MEEMTCPQCQSAMSERVLGHVTVHQCTACQGVFLERADLGSLIEAENDWHRDSAGRGPSRCRGSPGHDRPAAGQPARRSRAYVETLFG